MTWKKWLVVLPLVGIFAGCGSVGDDCTVLDVARGGLVTLKGKCVPERGGPPLLVIPEPAEALAFDGVVADLLELNLGKGCAVAYSPENRLFYLADPQNSVVVVLTMQGMVVRLVGRVGTGPGEFDRPSGISVEGQRVIVCDSRNHRLCVFDPAVDYVGSCRVFNRPLRGVCSQDGHLYVICGYPVGPIIHKYRMDGAHLFSFGARRPECLRDVDPRSTVTPGMAIDRRGHLWCAYKHYYLLRCYDSSGKLLFSIEGDISGNATGRNLSLSSVNRSQGTGVHLLGNLTIHGDHLIVPLLVPMHSRSGADPRFAFDMIDTTDPSAGRRHVLDESIRPDYVFCVGGTYYVFDCSSRMVLARFRGNADE